MKHKEGVTLEVQSEEHSGRGFCFYTLIILFLNFMKLFCLDTSPNYGPLQFPPSCTSRGSGISSGQSGAESSVTHMLGQPRNPCSWTLSNQRHVFVPCNCSAVHFRLFQKGLEGSVKPKLKCALDFKHRIFFVEPFKKKNWLIFKTCKVQLIESLSLKI